MGNTSVMKKWVSILFVLISAILFGFLPTLVKLSYGMGNNGTNVSFFKSAIGAVIIFVILRIKNLPVLLDTKKLPVVIGWGGVSIGATNMLLAMSYEYIPVGIATVLHFVYPTVVAVFGWLLFHRTLNRQKLLALFLCTFGICFFLERSGNIQLTGVLLALMSGCTYAMYILSLEHNSVSGMHHLQLALYFMLISAVMAGIFGAIRGELVFQMPRLGWIYLILSSVLGMVAMLLFIYGVKAIGGLMGSVLSTMEPITSVLCGWIFLGEAMSGAKMIGSALVILSIFNITSEQHVRKKERE